ncbi:radical SAM family heme chaperone HemW [Collinsella stercoris]|uniref:radical SAM family heme chaperone HemW n=1 Tax=Collinsella stercoris TaxID=147206 RepID=UPI0026F2994F|nr:radical SAM family heme chaperone HemW [Collinsella stercoris]MBS6555377.1 radical SAM family heme chaperone HemW [Collinsella stercoris]
MRFEALYLHIPFCKSKCAYCDFDSRAIPGCALEEAVGTYCESLLAQVDVHGKAGELADVETVYIGGGTPSLLGGHLVELVNCIRTHCNPVEFTCEANPESFTFDLARSLRAAGVTRVSLGVQSLQADELRAIGRIHTAEQAVKAVALAREEGFSTSCDLMCGLPGQTLDAWRDTLKRVLLADPDHVSVYPLQLEEGTPLERLEAAGKIEVPDEDFQAQCMDIAAELLHAHSYERYEVASYAKPGHRCQHNIAYWTGVPYLGIGRSAASMCAATGDVSLLLENTFDGTPDSESDGTSDGAAGRSSANSSTARIRFTQLDDAGEEFDHEFLTPREAMAEDLMLACRMTDGIGPELLARAIRVVPANELSAACDRAVERKLAAWDNGTLKPTHLGWLGGNKLFGIFWDLAADA